MVLSNEGFWWNDPSRISIGDRSTSFDIRGEQSPIQRLSMSRSPMARRSMSRSPMARSPGSRSSTSGDDGFYLPTYTPIRFASDSRPSSANTDRGQEETDTQIESCIVQATMTTGVPINSHHTDHNESFEKAIFDPSTTVQMKGDDTSITIWVEGITKGITFEVHPTPIGYGAQGTVHRIYTQGGHHMAIKIMGDDESYNKEQENLELLAKHTGPRCCVVNERYIGVTDINGSRIHVFIMPIVDGTLMDLSRFHRHRFGNYRQLVLHIMDALRRYFLQLLQRGLIYLDIKPENIGFTITTDRQIRLTILDIGSFGSFDEFRRCTLMRSYVPKELLCRRHPPEKVEPTIVWLILFCGLRMFGCSDEIHDILDSLSRRRTDDYIYQKIHTLFITTFQDSRLDDVCKNFYTGMYPDHAQRILSLQSSWIK